MVKKIIENRKQVHGITLIALVITIIVLLILAGVSIAMLTGDNGILTQANNAKEATKKATEEEQRELAKIEASMSTENTYYYDSKGNKAIIPAGFAVSQVEGENEIDEGLVIIDAEGNEFVWIPCNETEYAPADSSWTKNDTYLEREWNDVQSTNIGLESVKKYKGFYVARYEAGIPESAVEIYSGTSEGEFGAKRVQRNSSAVIEKYTPVSKKGKQVWSSLWQTNAKTLAEKMKDNNFVKSYLMDSYSWNAICRVIEKKTENNIINSNTWGNYCSNTTTNYKLIDTLYGIYNYDTKWLIPDTINSGKISENPRNRRSSDRIDIRSQ